MFGIDLDYIATGRKQSLFAQDLSNRRSDLLYGLKGSRCAVIGAAGSIGASVLKCLLEFRPRGVALIDLSENNLVEVVRELRSEEKVTVPDEFVVLPIGLGSVECERFFSEVAPFDYILNLSAIKHVRSEKSIYSVLRMFDTNVIFPHRFLEKLPYRCRKFFSVSSDKASNPANLMGASKMVMEDMLLMHSSEQPFSSARFANVAFSDGSLPYGFLRRVQKGQPVAAPTDVKRFFMSHVESGQLCVMSCVLGANRDVFFPKLEAGLNEVSFAEIARDLIIGLGFEPFPCSSDAEARQRASELIKQRKWPCYFSSSDTTGEKPFEEFFLAEDKVALEEFENVGIVKKALASIDTEKLMRFLSFIEGAKQERGVTKADIVARAREVVPGFNHIELEKSLDSKM